MDILIYKRIAAGRPALVQTIADVAFPLELGRQTDDTEHLYRATRLEAGGRWRLVIAKRDQQTIGRNHVRIELLPGGGGVRVTNTSSASTVRLGDGALLPRGSPRDCPLSVDGLELILGDTVVLRLQQESKKDPLLAELPQTPRAPGTLSAGSGEIPSLPFPLVPGIDVPALVAWLQHALEVLQSPDFFQRATQAVVGMAGLDSGRVLLRDKSGWKNKAEATTWKTVPGESDPDRPPSTRILNKVHHDKKTVWELPPQAAEGSLQSVRAVVAAPILNAKQEVIGVLYGDRRQDAGRPITEVEALLVELLACGIAAGLARVEQERISHRFEQFFTPQLARHLAEHPEMLQGRIEEVTLLFCDVRNFSRISEHLGAERTVAWISNVMAELSDCVFEHKGVLVDYIGDELIAMWGAPEPQTDHAQLACRAAIAMLDKLPALNTRWESLLGEPMAFGVGLNSGEAQVGNTGSPRKFKYGPLGHTVNLASRVQGATKQLKARLLITGATHQLLDEELQGRARRLCAVRVQGPREPVVLYEFAASAQPAGADWKSVYEEALAQFEAEDFRGAARLLTVLTAHPINDGPSIVLLFRAVQGMKDGAGEKHPVWELPTK